MDFVSVIICHHKGNFVDDLLSSLALSRNIKYEAIVVTSEAGRKFSGSKTVFSNHGPSYKRNVGARFAQADYLAFLDDDTQVTEDFLYEMVKVLKALGVGMVYGKTLNMERRNMLDNAGSYLTWTGFLWAREESGKVEDLGQFDEPEEIFAGKGAAMALRKRTFETVHGFDPVYEILAEETDISWKVWFIGEKVMWAPKAVLFHAYNTRFKPWSYYYTNKRVYYNGCRNYILMLAKFLEWKHFFRIIPIHAAVWFFSGLGMFLTGKFEAGCLIWKGLLYHFSPVNWRNTLKRRNEVQALRTKSDQELFKKIMRQPKFSFYWNRFWHYVSSGRHG